MDPWTLVGGMIELQEKDVMCNFFNREDMKNGTIIPTLIDG